MGASPWAMLVERLAVEANSDGTRPNCTGARSALSYTSVESASRAEADILVAPRPTEMTCSCRGASNRSPGNRVARDTVSPSVRDAISQRTHVMRVNGTGAGALKANPRPSYGAECSHIRWPGGQRSVAAKRLRDSRRRRSPLGDSWCVFPV